MIHRRLFFVHMVLQLHLPLKHVMAPPRRPSVMQLPAPAAQPTLASALEELNGALFLICVPARCAHVRRLVFRMRIPKQRFVVISASLKQQIHQSGIVDMLHRGMLSTHFPGLHDLRPNSTSMAAARHHQIHKSLLVGRLACATSHRRAHETFLKSAFDTVVIIEDDVRLDMAATSKQEEIYVALVRSKRDWDVLYLGSCYEHCSTKETRYVWAAVRTFFIVPGSPVLSPISPCTIDVAHVRNCTFTSHVCADMHGQDELSSDTPSTLAASTPPLSRERVARWPLGPWPTSRSQSTMSSLWPYLMYPASALA